MFLNVQIALPDTEKAKGRVFSALVMGYMEANALWDLGASGEAVRPVWFTFVTSDAQARPFLANLQTGRKCQTDTRHGKRSFELMRSAGYEWVQQRVRGGSTVVTAFLPDLFRLDPGMVDPLGIKFIAAPSIDWMTEHRKQIHVEGDLVAFLKRACPFLGHQERWGASVPSAEEVAPMLPLASLFCAYLDRRVRFPLLGDPRFQMQLFLACLQAKLARFSVERDVWGHAGDASLFKAEGMKDCKLTEPVSFKAKHEEFGTLLAEQVALYYKALDNRAATR